MSNVPDSINNSPIAAAALTKFNDPLIQPKDVLFVTVQTIDQVPDNNTPINSQGTGGVFNPLNGIQVDDEGYIELSLVGRIRVGGLTTSQAREVIKEKAVKYYKEPVVNVRIANNEITILGEVNKPGTYNFLNEKVGLLDAIGMANDLTIYGQRKNVLLTREENGEKKFIRFNLQSSDIFQSPYYYLHHGDVIYVEPNKAKVVTSDNRVVRNVAIASSLISIASFLLVFTRK